MLSLATFQTDTPGNRVSTLVIAIVAILDRDGGGDVVVGGVVSVGGHLQKCRHYAREGGGGFCSFRRFI